MTRIDRRLYELLLGQGRIGAGSTPSNPVSIRREPGGTAPGLCLAPPAEAREAGGGTTGEVPGPTHQSLVDQEVVCPGCGRQVRYHGGVTEHCPHCGANLQQTAEMARSFDAGLYRLHLAQERLNLSWAGVIFDPSKHPRGFGGKFAEAVWALKVGQTARIRGSGVTVAKEPAPWGSGFFYHIRDGSGRTVHRFGGMSPRFSTTRGGPTKAAAQAAANVAVEAHKAAPTSGAAARKPGLSDAVEALHELAHQHDAGGSSRKADRLHALADKIATDSHSQQEGQAAAKELRSVASEAEKFPDMPPITPDELRPGNGWNDDPKVIRQLADLVGGKSGVRSLVERTGGARLTEQARGWGKVSVGDRVTSQGRHGVGQAPVTGKAERIEGQTVHIRTSDGKLRRRTISNVRKA